MKESVLIVINWFCQYVNVFSRDSDENRSRTKRMGWVILTETKFHENQKFSKVKVSLSAESQIWVVS